MKFGKITIGLCALMCFASLSAGCKDRSEEPPSDEGSLAVYSVGVGATYNNGSDAENSASGGDGENSAANGIWANSSPGGAVTSSSSSSTNTSKPAVSSSEHVHRHKVIDSVKATCVEKGWSEYACECGDRYIADLAATGHSYSKKTVIADCENYGCTRYTCAKCGDSYDKDVTDALGHIWGEWTETKEATTSAEGERQSTCSRCEKTRTETIPKLESSSSTGDFTSEVVRLVNIERENNGLSPLSENSTLGSFAQLRSSEIVSNFSHTRPDGTSPLNYVLNLGGFHTCGENIAMGQQTPEAVVTAWMNSEGHRANILNEEFSMIGVGCYKSGGTYHWVQIFGG